MADITRLRAAYELGQTLKHAKEDREYEQSIRDYNKKLLQQRLNAEKLDEMTRDLALATSARSVQAETPGQPQIAPGLPPNIMDLLTRLKTQPVTPENMPIPGALQTGPTAVSAPIAPGVATTTTPSIGVQSSIPDTRIQPAFQNIPLSPEFAARYGVPSLPGTNLEMSQAATQAAEQRKAALEAWKKIQEPRIVPKGSISEAGGQVLVRNVDPEDLRKAAEERAGKIVPGTEFTTDQQQRAAVFQVLQPDGTYKNEVRILGKQGKVSDLLSPEEEAQKIRIALASKTPASVDAATQKSYQYTRNQLQNLAKPVDEAVARLGRLKDALVQATPTADALIAPELLTVMAGGPGSGLRMTEAEIARIVGGRSVFENLRAKVQKFSLEPTKANSITPAQRKQISDLVNEVERKLLIKQQTLSDADTAIIDADPQGHKQVLADVKQRLSAVDRGMPTEIKMPDGAIWTLGTDGKYHGPGK